MSKPDSKTKILAECAILCAISCVLSIFPKFKFLAQGGSITFCSMLPIVLVSYRRGIKWGLLTGLCFALFQFLTGFTSSGLSIGSVILSILLDYLVAFTVLGFGGAFRGRLGSVRKELCRGALLALGLRYLSSTISGAVLFGQWAEWFFGELGAFGQSVLATFQGAPLYIVYSIVYNGSYMIPEMIITVAVAAFLAPYALYGIKSAEQLQN